MATLGNLGNLYVVLLFLLLLGGIGILSLNFSRKYWSKAGNWVDKIGGKPMNKWFKVAAISFVGVLIASFALGLTGTVGSGADVTMGSMGGINIAAGASDQSAHTGHHPGGQQNAIEATGANLAGYNQGMNNIGNNMGNAGTSNTGSGMNYDNMGAQMYMMQMNIMRMQQQLEYLMQLYSRQNYDPGPIGIPGNMNGSTGMNNIGTYK